ncbi:MAG: Serine/threonine-protein kinase PknD [Gammaproteobacteria bacterium]|nr:Serine/threonine-protein kinase PknD [Gammaproteobacteria bacterium]
MQSAARTTAPALPERIGRFRPTQVIGQGGQGVVYLARDPDLDRFVAVKTLTRRCADPGRMVTEARHAARLQHPNIVTLLEIGTHEELPFLVYQYAEGTSLKQMLDAHQPIPPARAIALMLRILEGIAHAHRAGILHRDLTPGNILVDSEGNPLILDFGISSLVGMTATGNNVLGTPNYMSPENLSGGEVGPAADIFSLAVILHEMLTGHPLVVADNAMTAMYKVMNETFLPPSVTNPAIDAPLDEIVMHGLQRDPARRYANAQEFMDALKGYVDPQDAPRELDGSTGGNGAVDFLLRRLNRRPDFPAISRHVAEITQKTSKSDDTHANELANVILKDFALTSKLLKLVNSSVYRHGGGSAITTISRAVMILGFEQVRQAALNLTMFEHLKNAEQAQDMRNSLLSSFFSAMVARDLATDTHGVGGEEVFIVALFLRLGKHLAIFYFPEEYREIERQVANRGSSELKASKEVLGASYVELGAAIARQWQLPDLVVRGISCASSAAGTQPDSPADRAVAIAAFSNELAEVFARGGPDVAASVEALASRYRRTLKIDAEALRKVVTVGMERVTEYARILNISTRDSALCAGISKATGRPVPATDAAAATDATGGAGAEAAATAEESGDAAMKRRMLLINSISEIATTVMGEYDLNNVLVMILETLYRGIGFSRVLMVVKDARSRCMQARFGFGEGVNELIPKFRYSLDGGSDIFLEAATTGREFVVVDTTAADYLHRIPSWCRSLTAPRAVVLLPIVVNKAVISLIYADFTAAGTRISVEEIKLFATLTKQAALAIHQKSQRR